MKAAQAILSHKSIAGSVSKTYDLDDMDYDIGHLAEILDAAVQRLHDAYPAADGVRPTLDSVMALITVSRDLAESIQRRRELDAAPARAT